MSDRMRGVPFAVLMDGILREYELSGTIFGVPPVFRAEPGRMLSLFGESLETPVGPAAGPHTQLAQNLIAAYAAGARFFELKTVQTLDGEDLPVSKPCILAENEGYNVEWSTELTVPDAMNEYVKGWVAIQLLSRELGLGREDGFVFNMSVGYDLEGIRSAKIDAFLEGLKDASGLPIWRECMEVARALLPRLRRVDEGYLETLSPRVSRSVTLSTLHGCPAAEIERIAAYLMGEKGLHTFVKCNPTLLGYEFARTTLDAMGYDALDFDDHHFREDLQFEDAVPMLERLRTQAGERGLTFGVKLTNTFPVNIVDGCLPGEEMYLSGKALAPLTLALAEKLSRAFAGTLRISYSGGADAFHIAEIFRCGIWPITVATTLLKPGGYLRLTQLARLLSGEEYRPFAGVEIDRVSALAHAVRLDAHHVAPVKPIPSRKLAEKVPLLDCFTAPCKGGCPFGQDAPEYLRLLGEGKAGEALRVILEKNPLPHITGTICSHPCTAKCVRGWYETPVRIRAAKLEAARAGWAAVLPKVEAEGARPDLKIAVVGGGPAGMACAYLLARLGAKVTILEKTGVLGGVVRHVIPKFRIGADAVESDAELLRKLGVEVRLNTEASSAQGLLERGFTHVILAVGTEIPVPLAVRGDAPMSAISFLRELRQNPAETFGTPAHVVVAGGGNVAMDAARAALRLPGVKDVTIAYRRTARYMPADTEELELAKAEGVLLRELLTPEEWDAGSGSLVCRQLVLGERDESGRRRPVATGETVTLPAQLLIAAVGERADGTFFACNGVAMDDSGRPVVHSVTLESGLRNVYVAGDARRGPATVAEAIADAHRIADAIAGEQERKPLPAERPVAAMGKKGTLQEPGEPARESDRCLECAALCQLCVDVCPNRANVAVVVPTRGQHQIVHVDGMCNECGNCASFCPYDSAPYREKFTVFGSLADFEDSSAPGFVLLDALDQSVRVRLDGLVLNTTLRDEHSPLPSGIHELMETICGEYPHLLY